MRISESHYGNHQWGVLTPRPRPLLGQTVLAVEDEVLIAMDLEKMLADAGADVVCAASVADAIREATQIKLTAAVLDVQLGNESVEPVCNYLQELRVPFIFATGYHNPPSPRWEPVPRISKPYSTGDIVQGIWRALVRGTPPAVENVARITRLRQLIAEAESRIWRHQELIERLEARGLDTASADELLMLMNTSLGLLRDGLKHDLR